MNHPLSWFIDHIGKRIYRLTKTNCCNHCREVEENGLIVNDKQHADYLWCCQNEMDLIYTDEV